MNNSLVNFFKSIECFFGSSGKYSRYCSSLNSKTICPLYYMQVHSACTTVLPFDRFWFSFMRIFWSVLVVNRFQQVLYLPYIRDEPAMKVVLWKSILISHSEGLGSTTFWSSCPRMMQLKVKRKQKPSSALEYLCFQNLSFQANDGSLPSHLPLLVLTMRLKSGLPQRFIGIWFSGRSVRILVFKRQSVLCI